VTHANQSLAVALALAGSGCYAVAVAAQQSAAVRMPAKSGRRAFDPAVLVRLARCPAWLAGLVMVIAGFMLQAAAVGIGRLVLIEPVLASGLLFALALAAWRDQRRLRAVEWAAALAAVAGIAAFVGASQPAGGQRTADAAALGVTAGAVAALVVLCSLLASRVPARWRAVVLGIAGGAAAGANDALTKSAAVLAASQRLGLFADIRLYLLVIVGMLTYTIQQNGYRAGQLTAFLPSFAVVEAVSGSLLGLLIYHERLSGQPVQIGVEVLACSAAVWGIAQLARPAMASFACPAATADRLGAAAAVPAGALAKPAVPPAKPAVPLAKPAVPPAKPAVPPAKPAVPPAKPAVPPAKPAVPVAKPAVAVAGQIAAAAVPGLVGGGVAAVVPLAAGEPRPVAFGVPVTGSVP
jgi:hypothetical protein